MTASDAHRTIQAVWRIESPKLIAGLARMVRDVGRAEELAQEALVTALRRHGVRAQTLHPTNFRRTGFHVLSGVAVVLRKSASRGLRM